MKFDMQLQVTQVFLVAISILTVALAEARNQKLKTCLSFAGAALAAGWILSFLDAQPDSAHAHTGKVLGVMPYPALAGWLFSIGIHGSNWIRGIEPEGAKK